MPCGIPMDAFLEAAGESMPLKEADKVINDPRVQRTLAEFLRRLDEKTVEAILKKMGKLERNKMAALRRALETLEMEVG